ncbi:hypothetical protein [Candidatus Marimicrobium litorale]|nr:hypothetical protein [Candidatus Marimicrobium litorale]
MASDGDADGVTDCADNCPSVPSAGLVNSDDGDDACHYDNDSVPDDNPDNCATGSNPEQTDSNGYGCGAPLSAGNWQAAIRRIRCGRKIQAAVEMRKTDKKRDNALRVALTDTCEIAIERFEGFKWLTHLVDYCDFPQSLTVVCVFATNSHLLKLRSTGQESELRNIVSEKLSRIDIELNGIDRHVIFDSEENGADEKDSKWLSRFR